MVSRAQYSKENGSYIVKERLLVAESCLSKEAEF